MLTLNQSIRLGFADQDRSNLSQVMRSLKWLVKHCYSRCFVIIHNIRLLIQTRRLVHQIYKWNIFEKTRIGLQQRWCSIKPAIQHS